MQENLATVDSNYFVNLWERRILLFWLILRGNKQWLNCGNYSTTALHKPTHYEEELAKNLFRNFTPVFLHMLKYSWA